MDLSGLSEKPKTSAKEIHKVTTVLAALLP